MDALKTTIPSLTSEQLQQLEAFFSDQYVIAKRPECCQCDLFEPDLGEDYPDSVLVCQNCAPKCEQCSKHFLPPDRTLCFYCEPDYSEPDY